MNKTIFSSALLIIIILIAFSCCKKNESCINCPPPPPDTTSHAIQWKLPDTLGTQGIIRDVWVFDRNNAWAVGEIYLNDSTGKPNMENPYNAAHWDGSIWTIKKITVNHNGNMITPPECNLCFFYFGYLVVSRCTNTW
jgi:hypothetical protein